MLQAESLRRCFRVTNQRLNSLVLIDTGLSAYYVFSILDLLPRFTRILSYFEFYLR